MSVATMVVRIGANVDDLTKGMDKATKEVAKASAKIAELGKMMTLYITAPVAIAGYEFAKLAAEADSLGDRLDRVFGDKAQAMNDFITELRKTVPESTMSMQKMAIEIENLSLNMGASRDAAFGMSKGIIQMAADAAAFAHVPMEEALQAFERGLAGKTRGLVQFGMYINLAQIKQEGFRLGLIKTGETLTPLGVQLASFALMQQQNSRIAGEAGRIAGEESVQFSQLKANFIDMAVKLGTLVLPAVITLVNSLNTMMQWLSNINPEVLKFTLLLLGMAATIGPILGLVAGIGKIVVAIRAITAAVAAAGTVMEFLAVLTAPEIVIGIALIAAAITGITMAVEHFSASAKKVTAKMDPQGNIVGAGGGTAAAAGGATGYVPGAGGGDKTLFEQAKAIASEFQYAQQRGLSLLQFYDQAATAQTKLTQLAKTGADDVKVKAIAALRALQPLADEKVFKAMGLGKETGQLFGLPSADVLSRISEKTDMVNKSFTNIVNQGGDLTATYTEAFRLAGMLDDIIAAEPDKLGEIATAAGIAYEKLRPLLGAGELQGFSGDASGAGRKGDAITGHPFNAGAQASMDWMTETTTYFRQLNTAMVKLPPAFDATKEAALALKLQFEKFQRDTKQGIEDLKAEWAHFKTAIHSAADWLTAFQAGLLNVINTMESMVQQLANNIAAKIGGGSGAASIGAQLGGAFGSGIGMAMGGPIGAAIGSSIGTIGGAVIGKTLGKIGGAISGLFGHHHAAKALDNLAAAAAKVTAALLNVPTGYRVALARFNATGIGGPVTASSGSSGVTHFNGPIYIDARSKSIKQLLDELAITQRQQTKRGGSSTLSVALSGA